MNIYLVQKMKVTYVGVEVIDLKSGDLRWCLDFRDMDSPAIVLLAEAYGRKNIDHGGFVLCSLYGRKSKAFQAASGTSNAAIISNLVWDTFDFSLLFKEKRIFVMLKLSRNLSDDGVNMRLSYFVSALNNLLLELILIY